jgi:hypothetical protein
MQLMPAVADRWGSDERPGGQRVWFEMRPAAPETGRRCLVEWVGQSRALASMCGHARGVTG